MNDRTMTQDDQSVKAEEDRDRGVELEPSESRAGMSTAEMARAMEHSGTASATARPAVQPEMGSGSDGAEPLFPGDEAESFRARWTGIQTGFVDEPRAAVAQADTLVAEVIQRLAQVFADERQSLEQQWGEGDSGDTEGLRMALRRYRSFFERLLSA